MDFDTIFGYVMMFCNFAPIILFFACVVVAFPLGIWAVIDLANLQKIEGNIKRGIKIWSQPLTAQQLHYFHQLTGNIIEEANVPRRKPSFIQKKDGQVLISARNQQFIRLKTAPCLGYIDLASPNPVLEFRSSLPYHLLLLVVAFAFFPIIIAFLINFFIEKQAIENFLRQKVTV